MPVPEDVPDGLSGCLSAAENAYRTAVMDLVPRADDVEPLARVAAHLADMAAALRRAAADAMGRVDLFDSTSAAARAAEHTVMPDTLTDEVDGAEVPYQDDLGEAAIHMQHLVHLLEAAETMAGHATEQLLRAAAPD